MEKKKSEHAEHEKHKGKKEKKRLVRQEVEETEDGHYLHHHTYRNGKGEHEHRKNVAVSASPEEAGEHVAEQFGMNEQPEDDEHQPDEASEQMAGEGGATAPAAPGQ